MPQTCPCHRSFCVGTAEQCTIYLFAIPCREIGCDFLLNIKQPINKLQVNELDDIDGRKTTSTYNTSAQIKPTHISKSIFIVRSRQLINHNDNCSLKRAVNSQSNAVCSKFNQALNKFDMCARLWIVIIMIMWTAPRYLSISMKMNWNDERKKERTMCSYVVEYKYRSWILT